MFIVELERGNFCWNVSVVTEVVFRWGFLGVWSGFTYLVFSRYRFFLKGI